MKKLFYVNNSSVHTFSWVAIQMLIPENIYAASRAVHAVLKAGHPGTPRSIT